MPNPAPPSQHLQRYRRLARALDARFGIPGTPFRFGWDALIGLIPGFGDAAGSLLGGYGIYTGAKLGAPLVVLARMLLNLGIDMALGAVPVLGDLIDFAFRANQRNLALLEAWLSRPHQTRRRSTWLLVLLATPLALLAALTVWLAVRLLRVLLWHGL